MLKALVFNFLKIIIPVGIVLFLIYNIFKMEKERDEEAEDDENEQIDP